MNSETITVRQGNTQDDIDTALRIRTKVFVDEQGVPLELEQDGLEDICDHFLIYAGKKPIGTGRLRPVDDTMVKFERMAVLRKYRNQGVGGHLLEAMLDYARERGFHEATLNAQMPAYEFYDRAGFQPIGEPFMEAGIEHIQMVRSL